ncbi:MAG: hypothetical protein ACAI44_26730 [Candidatus Sericytochromatia bacterium]
MNINLTVIDPPGYIHTQAFTEIIELYRLCLEDQGHRVACYQNRLKPDGLNLIFAYHHLPPGTGDQLAQKIDYIVVQLEQLNFEAGWFRHKQDFFLAQLPLLQNARQVWDYSLENVTFLKQYGIQARLMPIGTHPGIRRFELAAKPDIDVLFYGSGNPRRARILDELSRHCQLRALHGEFGEQRDQLIARSKIVLNIHAFDEIALLEQVRLFYLLSHGCFVLSEAVNWNPYHGGIVTYPTQELVTGVLDWLAKPAPERNAIATLGQLRLQQLDQPGQLRRALEEVNS